MALEDILTLPLKVAQDLMTRPVQPPADPATYATAKTQAEVQSGLPDFFRQAAANIAQAEQVRQAQEQQYQANVAQAAPVDTGADAGPVYTPQFKTLMESRAAAAQAAAAQPSPDLTPAAQTQGPEGALTQAGGGLWGALTDIGKEALAPVGHAIESGIEATGRGIESLPGGERVGTAVENLPRAAAKFKEIFGHEFQSETGQRLNLESAYNAIINSPGQEADEALAHTLDPVINNTIGNLSPRAARFITGAIDQAGAMAPYVIIGILAPPLEAPMAASFALQGVSGVKELTEQYRAGNINGRDFLLGVGLNGAMVAGPVFGPLLSHIMPYFKGPGVAAKAIRDIDEAIGKRGEVEPVARGVAAAEALQKNAPSYEQMAEEKFGPGASLTREERMAQAATRVGPETPAIPEGVPAPLPKAAEAAAIATPAAAEQQFRPVFHGTTEEAAQGIYGAGEIRPTKAATGTLPGVYVHTDPTLAALSAGTSSRLTGSPEHIVEARLRADLNIAPRSVIDEYQARLGLGDTPGDMQKLADALKADGYDGADHSLRMGNVTRERLVVFDPKEVQIEEAKLAKEIPAPKEAVSAVGREVTPPEAVGAGARNEAGNWDANTFDKVPRRLINRSQYGEIWQKQDGSFDFIDKRFGDMRTGTTAGVPDVIRNFPTHEEALQALEDLNAHFAKSPEQRLGAFHNESEAALPKQEAAPLHMESDSALHQRLKDIDAAYEQGHIGGVPFTHEQYTKLRGEVEQEIRRRLQHSEWQNASPADLAREMRGLSLEELHHTISTVDINENPRVQKAAEAEWRRRGEVNRNPTVVEATQVAQQAQAAREDVAAANRYRQRPVREAEEASRAEQTFGPMVKDTMGENGGATYNIRTGEPVPYRDHFVGGFAPTKTISAADFTSLDLAHYVRDNFDVFRADHDIHVGTERVTRDGKEFINIDAVKQFADRDEALRIARENGEQRIWDANNNQAIEVPGVKQVEKSVSKTVAVEGADKFLNGERGALDWKKMGTVAKSWMEGAGDAVRRVIAAVKELGRTFHSNELGAIIAGRKKFSLLNPDDLLDFGASRRWLHPEEDWATWAKDMKTRVGATEEFWMNRKGDVISHVEKMTGLLGEGKQSVTEGGVRFGPEAGPATYERLSALVREGRFLKENGKVIDMTKWYNGFWKTMKEHFGDDAEIFTQMMAITQQNNSPAGGVQLALRAYIQWKMGEPISRMGNKNIREQMEALLMGHLPSGNKVPDFLDALRYAGARGENAVAVDRWVIMALGGKSDAPGGSVKYLQGNERFIRFSQNLIRLAADEAGISPRAFQAAIWGGFRKEWNVLVKAAGGNPLNGSNDYFENLLVKKLEQYRLRSPATFRLNTPAVMQRSLFDAGEEAGREVEFWQKGQAEALARQLHIGADKAEKIQNDMMYAEFNKKIAASHMLDTGEIPAHLKTPEVIDDVKRTAAYYRDTFSERIRFADDQTLKDIKVAPDWQKRLIAEELAVRKRTGDAVIAAWEGLPKDEQRRLKTLGWMNVPDDPRAIGRTTKLLQDLDKVTTEQELIRWMNRSGAQAIVGDKSAFIGKMIPTGETYIDAAGKTVRRTDASPYWEPRSFYENRLVLNVDKAKQAIRDRFPTDTPLRRRGAEVLGIIKDDKNLGPCGINAAASVFE